MKTIEFNPKILKYFFSPKVRELCKSCKRFGQKATCPPFVESLTYYRELLPQYKHGIIFIEKFILKDYGQSNWEGMGICSSKVIHDKLLEKRAELLKNGKFAIIFGAGSCKLCSDKCTFPCKHPEKSAIPIEATGIDVVSLLDNLANISIKFPIEKQGYFYRVGMILFDD